MNDDDPMLGTEQERDAYQQQILDLVEQDADQRRQQRLSDFLRTRDSPAVIQGVVGPPDSLIQALR
jgi:hypothetical protein